MSNKRPIGGVCKKPLVSRLNDSISSSHEKDTQNRQYQDQYPLENDTQIYPVSRQQYTTTPFQRVHLQQAANIGLMDRINVPTEQENLINMQQGRQKRMRNPNPESLPISFPPQPLISRVSINPNTKKSFGDLRLHVSIDTTISRRLSNSEEQISKILKLESNTFEEETMQIELPNEGTEIHLNNKDKQSSNHLNKSPISKDSASLNDNDEQPMDIDKDEDLNIPVTPNIPVMDPTVPFYENTQLLKIMPRFSQPLRECLSAIPLTSPIGVNKKQKIALKKMRQHEYQNLLKGIEYMLNKMQFSYEKKTSQTSSGLLTSEDEKENCTANKLSVKRKLSLIEVYPMMIGTGLKSVYILGPNGTKISLAQYSQVPWNSTLAATRKLLNILFSDRELATQTLSGRESLSEKYKLDPARVEDIIVCVRNVIGGREQHSTYVQPSIKSAAICLADISTQN